MEIPVITKSNIPTQTAKQLVNDYCEAFDNCETNQLISTLQRYSADEYQWRGMHPFHEQTGAQATIDSFWKPLRHAFSSLQRRPDIFLANTNSLNDAAATSEKTDQPIWTCQMGHFMGLFDKAWLNIPPTQKMTFIRFAEFHQVQANQILQSALFIDLIGVMRQAGQYPLPPQTGASFIYPGPQTHDGLLYEPQPEQQATNTLNLIERMINDLSQANETAAQTGVNKVPRSVLAKTWVDDMIWYGPEGIGATYTIDRYQQQHQYPFRFNLAGKTFNGHVARFAEGNYGCFFGWPNLTNTPTGGFMGLPGSNLSADMRVVDVYRSNGTHLVENWVIIDLPHWLAMQGLDILARMRQLLGLEKFGA